MNVTHIFYEVAMGIGHKGALLCLADRGKKSLGKNEVAVFINKSWTAAKILCSGGMMIYYRPPTGIVMPEVLRFISNKVPSTKLTWGPKLEAGLLKRFETDVGEHVKTLKQA
jgi:hypothetical protein